MGENGEIRREFFKKGVVASLGVVAGGSAGEARVIPGEVGEGEAKPEPVWRNRKEDMAYRMLGRTGMMVSEIGMGTYPYVSEEVYPLFDATLERGVNYVDCAAAYSGGRVEENLGKYFKQRGNRDSVFLTTKLSGLGWGGNFRKLYEGLSAERKAFLKKKADELLEERMVLRPGYHFDYFDAQAEQLRKAHLWHVVAQEYGRKKEWREPFKERAYRLLEESLKRLQVEEIDVLFCPHGAAGPVLRDDVLEELFAEFKKKGLIRAAAVSFHNDVAGNLAQAMEVGYYDVAMFAYNVGNHASVDGIMHKAKGRGMGLVGMKLSRLFAMGNQPRWLRDKLESLVPGKELSIYAKSYLWALQNPNFSLCVSQMETVEQVKDNLQVVGKKLAI